MNKLFLASLLPIFFCIGCQSDQHRQASGTTRAAATGKTKKVRTTAYTHTEAGGSRNAIGQRLSSGKLTSAASDWSRFPLGTQFQIVQTGQQYVIDDYGSALVGTNTIDLYKTSRSSMRKWGVRHVDIRILKWGSPERSLVVLQPRKRNRHVRAMVAQLREEAKTPRVKSS